MGFAFQAAALFDSLTVAQNVSFPLYEHTQMTRTEIDECVTRHVDSLGLVTWPTVCRRSFPAACRSEWDSPVQS